MVTETIKCTIKWHLVDYCENYGPLKVLVHTIDVENEYQIVLYTIVILFYYVYVVIKCIEAI